MLIVILFVIIILILFQRRKENAFLKETKKWINTTKGYGFNTKKGYVFIKKNSKDNKDKIKKIK